MSIAEIGIVTCVLLTNAAVRGRPFTFTTAPITKFHPFTASVKAGPPATALDGLRNEIVGAGRKTLKAMLVELPPPGAGLTVETKKIPALEMSATEMAAVSCLVLINVVGLAVPPNNTLEPLTKFVPFTVSVKLPLPICSDVGEIDEMVGRELPPPMEIGSKIETVLSRKFNVANPDLPTGRPETSNSPDTMDMGLPPVAKSR